jgi:exopolysaccharide biosynthesis polyprenyl glycosylphosphotransferase
MTAPTKPGMRPPGEASGTGSGGLPVRERRLALVLMDLVCVLTGFVIAFNVRTGPIQHGGLFLPKRGALIAAGLWLACGVLTGAFDLRAAIRFRDSMRRVVINLAAATTAMLAVFFAFPFSSLTRSALALWPVAALPLLLLSRLLYRRVFASSYFAGRLLLVVREDSLANIWPEISQQLTGMYHLAAIVDPSKPGYEEKLRGALQRRHIDEIIVGVRDDISRDLFRALLAAHASGVPVRSLADLYEEITGRLLLDQLGHSWLLSLPMRSRRSPVYRLVSRTVDIISAALALGVLALLLPVMIPLIKLDGGSVFFSQPRVGRFGRIFNVLKLRTMRMGTDTRWTERGDARVTRVGRVLRRLHLDELPQALAIIRGDMGLVGPRPEQPAYADHLRSEVDFYDTRHAVRPGLTGWAQVNHGYTSDTAGARLKLSYDLYYVKHQTITLDLLILARTVRALVAVPGR